MASEIKIRGGHRAIITNRIKSLEQEQKATSPDDVELKTIIQTIKFHLTECDRLDGVIWSNMSDDELLVDMQESSDRKHFANRSIISASDYLHSAQGTQQLTRQADRVIEQGMKLPTLKLPEFDGTITKWKSFCDEFTASVNDQRLLSDVQRLSYLKGCLTGSASKLIGSIPISNENYSVAFQLLRDNFGDEDRIKETHVLQIFDLTCHSMAVRDLSEFHSDLEFNLRALDSLHVEVDNSHIFLVPLLKRKLPKPLWEAIYSSLKTDYPTLADLRKELTARVRHLESSSIQSPVTSLPKSGNSPQPPHIRTIACTAQTSCGQAKITPTASREQHLNLTCIFCDAQHTSAHCNRYGLVRDRKDRANYLNRCTICLNKSHSADKCGRTILCKVCEGKHHTAFCFKAENSVAGKRVEATVSCSASTTGLQPTVVPTMSINISSGEQHGSCRALMDNCSQLSFVSSSLVARLNLPYIEGEVTAKVQTFGKTMPTRTTKYPVVEITCNMGRNKIRIRALEVPHILDDIEVRGLTRVCQSLQHSGYRLADPSIRSDKLDELELLIGSDQISSFMLPEPIRLEFDTIILTPTAYGFVISGRIPEKFLEPNQYRQSSYAESGLKRLPTWANSSIIADEGSSEDGAPRCTRCSSEANATVDLQ